MVTVSDIFSACACPLSFEIFPPKGDLTLGAARAVVAELAPLAPDFVSVTYSAGGSGNSRATAVVAAMVQEEFDIPAGRISPAATRRKIRLAPLWPT